MDNIALRLDDAGRGAFIIEDGGQRVAEMEIAIKDGALTVYQVIPLCPFVHAQFKRNPQQYADLNDKLML